MAVTVSIQIQSLLLKMYLLLFLIILTTNVPQNHASENDNLKKQLIPLLNGIDRGASASKTVQEKISHLVSQLELINPNPVVSEAVPVLNGSSVLVYTTFAPALPFLKTGLLPLVTVGKITETIVSDKFVSSQSADISIWAFHFSVSTNCIFEARNPNRIIVKFKEIIIDRHNGKPVVKIPVNFQLQLLLTYVDEELRVNRADDGSMFLFLKEGRSPLHGWTIRKKSERTTIMSIPILVL